MADMKTLFAALFALIALPLAAQDAQSTSAEPETAHETAQIVLETTMGNITIAVETARAPITAANFLRYVDDKRFDGTVFYRAMTLNWGEQPNGLIQGGTENDRDRILAPIAHEPTSETGILHKRGTISMARYDPGTATGDFSIMLQELTSLDAQPNADNPSSRAGFAAFGHVITGMNVVEAIHKAPIDMEKGEGYMQGQLLADPVVIISARRVETVE